MEGPSARANTLGDVNQLDKKKAAHTKTTNDRKNANYLVIAATVSHGVLEHLAFMV